MQRVRQDDHGAGAVFFDRDAATGEINGSSVGAAHNGKLVVGAVFDGHVMVCPLP